MMITMTTTLCVLVCGLNSLMVYLDVKRHDVWERDTTTMGEIQVENIRSQKFWDIILRRSDIKEVDITKFSVYAYFRCTLYTP